MRFATWNINSVRLRINDILKFIKKYKIDTICLQETKTENEYFPVSMFEKLGFKYSNIRGQKSYNGVAILSKIRFSKCKNINWCGLNDSRHISVKFKNNIILHNFYVPAGGDIPDIKLNLKFEHKINFLEEMLDYFKKNTKKMIVVGDLNIAPYESDVWSHKQLIKVVSHSPIETKIFTKLLNEGNLIDIIREKFNNEKIYTWWSYRSKNWKIANKGRRLDHILVSKNLKHAIKIEKICKELRDVSQPSDHVPVIAKIIL